MGTRFVNLSAWVIILACFAFLNLGFARNAYCKNDNALGDPVEISSYKLIDVLNGNIITESFDVPHNLKFLFFPLLKTGFLPTQPDRYQVSRINKTVHLGEYGDGVQYTAAPASAVITFNSRGFADNALTVSLTNDANSATYQISVPVSGIVTVNRFEG